MNAKWHEQHAMPRNATVQARIAWHREHQKHCACRPIPAKLLETMKSNIVPRVSKAKKAHTSKVSRSKKS